MDENTFFDKFQEQFIDSDEITIDFDTKFRELPSWDSLTGMSVLVMVQDDYNVEFNENDLRACHTVADIYNFIKSRKES